MWIAGRKKTWKAGTVEEKEEDKEEEEEWDEEEKE